MSEIKNMVSGEGKTIKVLKRKEFNLLDSAIACLAFIALQLVFEIVYGALPIGVKSIFIVAFFVMLIAEGIFAIAVIITSSSRQVDFISATGLNKKIDGVSVLVAIAISVISLFAFTGLTNVFVQILSAIGYESSASLSVPNFKIYILYVFLICVCPAIFEDLLFRGCILNGLKKLGNTKAVLLSALIFMLMHGGPDQTIHQFIIGIVLGYAYIASGSIWVPIIIHFMNNFIALTSAYLSGIYMKTVEGAQQIETVSSANNILPTFAYAIVSAAVGAFLIYHLIKVLKNRKELRESKLAQETSLQTEVKNDQEATNKSVNETENEKKEKNYSIWLYVISGVYLVTSWILALINGL